MNTEELQQLLNAQRTYFSSGATLSVQSRLTALNHLKETLMRHEEDVYAALRADLGKSRDEAYMCELGMVYSEIDYMLRHVRSLSREKRVRSPLAQFPSRSYVKPSPKGVVLIMSPWNYPLMLTLDPLVDALAAGNTAVLKPSAYAPHTADLLGRIVSEAFPPELVCLVTGGRSENALLLEQRFDHIFFTGSQSVGRLVMSKAAEHLTPVSLELGGKSPCIVDETADIRLAARRIVFGKFLNCGQTCVAPDYILCHRSVLSRLESALKEQVQLQFGKEPLDNPNYGKIVNEKHFRRLCGLLEGEVPICGGTVREEELRISPTILSPCSRESAAMGEEIFGPILPILPYEDDEALIADIEAHDHPLALYVFSKNKAFIETITSRCSYGGGCVNDTIIHLATTRMGFGGAGPSGMGAYHGKVGFDTFSYQKSMVDKKCWLDLPMRYQPYSQRNFKLIRLFMK